MYLQLVYCTSKLISCQYFYILKKISKSILTTFELFGRKKSNLARLEWPCVDRLQCTSAYPTPPQHANLRAAEIQAKT
jgi:hypothetical protein